MQIVGSYPSSVGVDVSDEYRHVYSRLFEEHGDEAAEIVHKLELKERQRHASPGIQRINRARDIFTRNLRALEYIAADKANTTKEVVRQLYADAVEDLKQTYPPGIKSTDIDFYEVWKHCLDAARAQAEKKAGNPL